MKLSSLDRQKIYLLNMENPSLFKEFFNKLLS